MGGAVGASQWVGGAAIGLGGCPPHWGVQRKRARGQRGVQPTEWTQRQPAQSCPVGRSRWGLLHALAQSPAGRAHHSPERCERVRIGQSQGASKKSSQTNWSAWELRGKATSCSSSEMSTQPSHCGNTCTANHAPPQMTLIHSTLPTTPVGGWVSGWVSGPPCPHQGKFRRKVLCTQLPWPMALLKGDVVVASEGSAALVQSLCTH